MLTGITALFEALGRWWRSTPVPDVPVCLFGPGGTYQTAWPPSPATDARLATAAAVHPVHREPTEPAESVASAGRWLSVTPRSREPIPAGDDRTALGINPLRI